MNEKEKCSVKEGVALYRNASVEAGSEHSLSLCKSAPVSRSSFLSGLSASYHLPQIPCAVHGIGQTNPGALAGSVSLI